jgi:hypothetical protein
MELRRGIGKTAAGCVAIAKHREGAGRCNQYGHVTIAACPESSVFLQCE